MNNALKFDYLLLSQPNDFETTYNDFMEIIEQKSPSKQRKLILAKNRDFINKFYN